MNAFETVLFVFGQGREGLRRRTMDDGPLKKDLKKDDRPWTMDHKIGTIEH